MDMMAAVVLIVALFAVLWCATAAWLWFDTSHELDELFDAHLAQAAAMVVAQHQGLGVHGLQAVPLGQGAQGCGVVGIAQAGAQVKAL